MVPLLFALLASAPPAGAARPVIVELFTSEGCSSCPPADEGLADLWKRQGIAGARVIPLGLHVDYWNRLGWTDPFSQGRFSDRQALYDSVRGTRVFTPHALINGHTSLVGSDLDGIRAGVLAELAHPAALVLVTRTGSGYDVAISSVPPIQGRAASVLLAWAEEDLSSVVTAGENEGRTLTLAPVVRSLETLGQVGTDGKAHFTFPGAAHGGWRPEHLFPVVFIQRPDTLEILGSGVLPP